MSTGGCEGCAHQAFLNRNQQTIIQQQAQQYTNEKKISTVVYFDGQEFKFCEETVAETNGAANIVAIYAPQR